MGVAADDCHARQGRTLFGPDHVDDPLARIAERKVRLDSMLAHVGVELVDLHAGGRIGDAQLPVRRRRVVVGRGDHRLETPGFAASEPETLECLWAGHFVHQMAIDVQQRRPVRLGADDVGAPELVVERQLGHGGSGGTNSAETLKTSVKRAPAQ